MASRVESVVGAKLHGFEDLRLALRRLGSEVEKKGLTAAVEAGGRVVLEAARIEAPRDTGALAQSLALRVQPHRAGKKDASAKVGIDKRFRGGRNRRPVWYAHLIEFGHRKRSGGFVAPRPFLRPAIFKSRNRIFRVMQIALRLTIQRALRASKKG